MKKSDFDFLVKLAKNELGWEFSEQHFSALDKKISSFIRERNHKSVEQLIYNVKQGNKLLIEQLAEAITHINTSFFRDHKVFHNFRTLVLPKIKENGKASKKLNIWSCGCSSGQEVYSILIALKENNFLEDWQVSVVGTDYCSKSLAQALKGFYDNYEIQTGMNIKDIINNFSKKDNGWQANPEFSKFVEFRKYNLLNNPIFNNKFDIVFCRNIIKYFSPTHQKNIVKKLHSTQRAGGLLYIGLNESITDLDEYYEKVTGFPCLYQAKSIK